MKVGCITDFGSSISVKLHAVYSTDPNSENKSFTDATPQAAIDITIDKKKPAAAAFEVGREYYVDFTPAA